MAKTIAAKPKLVQISTAYGSRKREVLRFHATLFEASGEGVDRLFCWQLRQQQRVAYSDVIGIERLDGSGHEVS